MELQKLPTCEEMKEKKKQTPKFIQFIEIRHVVNSLSTPLEISGRPRSNDGNGQRESTAIRPSSQLTGARANFPPGRVLIFQKRPSLVQTHFVDSRSPRSDTGCRGANSGGRISAPSLDTRPRYPSKQSSSRPSSSFLPSFRFPEEAYTAVCRIHNHRFRSDAGVHPSVNGSSLHRGMAEGWTRSRSSRLESVRWTARRSRRGGREGEQGWLFKRATIR